MLFDVFFLGLPLAAAMCLVNLALKDGDRKCWTCAFSLFAYSAFYLAGGREVLLYICCYMLAGRSWVGMGQ
jgi:hypothetical protein